MFCRQLQVEEEVMPGVVCSVMLLSLEELSCRVGKTAPDCVSGS